MNGVVNINDLRKLAKKRLPKIAYDFIEGGTDDEVALATNEQAFRQARIVPRYLVDVSVRDQSTTLFGRTYSSVIGIAPTGLAGLFRRGADLMLAEAARDANVPFIMSGSSTASIEALGKLAPRPRLVPALFGQGPGDLRGYDQARGRRGPEDAGLHRRRAGRLQPRAQRAQRLGPAAQLSWETKLEALGHPAWMLEWIRHGTPYFDNWAKYAGPNATPEKIADLVAYPEPRTDDLEARRALSRAVQGQLRAEGHHASRRCGSRPFAGRRRHHGEQPRRAGSSTMRRRRSTSCRRSATRSATR